MFTVTLCWGHFCCNLHALAHTCIILQYTSPKSRTVTEPWLWVQTQIHSLIFQPISTDEQTRSPCISTNSKPYILALAQSSIFKHLTLPCSICFSIGIGTDESSSQFPLKSTAVTCINRGAQPPFSMWWSTTSIQVCVAHVLARFTATSFMHLQRCTASFCSIYMPYG